MEYRNEPWYDEECEDEFDDEPIYCEACGRESTLLEHGMCPMCYELNGYMP